MLKVIPVRLVVLADQVPVPMLPLGRLGQIVGFRFTDNTVDAGPTSLTFVAQNNGSPEHVESVVTGVPYIVEVPVFGDEENLISLSSVNTASAYHVDLELLVRE